MTKIELINVCATAMANKCKKEIEQQGKQWDLGNGFQTINTLTKTWINLYKKYPVKSKSIPAFDLTSTYNTLLNQGFIK